MDNGGFKMSFCEVGLFADVAYMQLGVHYEEHVHGFPMELL